MAVIKPKCRIWVIDNAIECDHIRRIDGTEMNFVVNLQHGLPAAKYAVLLRAAAEFFESCAREEKKGKGASAK